MKIVAISGNDRDKSHARFWTIIKGVKKKGFIVHELSPSSNFKEVLVSHDLFSDNELFAYANADKITPTQLSAIEKTPDIEASLLLLFKDKIPTKVKKSLPSSTKYETFDLPTILFTFLESVFPGNAKNALKLKEQLIKTEPLELVLAMLSRHLRELYWVLVSPETFKGPGWRVAKMSTQAKKWKKEELAAFISDISDADLASKSGGVPLDISFTNILASHLDV